MGDYRGSVKTLTDDEKIAFMKAAMPQMAELFQKEPQRMMAEMMPACMSVMKSKGMPMGMMPSMMKQMMGES